VLSYVPPPPQGRLRHKSTTCGRSPPKAAVQPCDPLSGVKIPRCMLSLLLVAFVNLEGRGTGLWWGAPINRAGASDPDIVVLYFLTTGGRRLFRTPTGYEVSTSGSNRHRPHADRSSREGLGTIRRTRSIC
jgi:hypothetical protein